MPKARFRFKPQKRSDLPESTQGKPDVLDLREDDIADQLTGDKFSALFLGSFEVDLIRMALERFDITPRLAKVGYPNIEIVFRPQGPFEHFLAFRDGNDPTKQKIGEIVLKEGRYQPCIQPLPHLDLGALTLLNIEWILMQHVRGTFSPERRRLPGQNHPGLGIGNQVVALLTWVAKLMHKDGLSNVPEYFHNAIFYDKWFKFVDPTVQGAMEAIFTQLSAKKYDICDISFAAYFDCFVDLQTGEPYLWKPHEMVMPLSGQLKAYFAGLEYRELVTKSRESLSIGIDEKPFREKMKTADQIEW